MISQQNIGILLFDGVELLDYAGPAEVFSVARLPKDDTNENPLFNIFTIAEEKNPIKPTSGSKIIPDYNISKHPKIDILIIPGGQGTRDEKRRTRLIPWVLKQNKTTKITASVCTGAFFLAEAGLLKEKSAATHWRGMQWMQNNHPEIKLEKYKRFVDEGHIITSAGISAGIDMALHIVERLYGEKTASWTARRMEYKWKKLH